MNQMIQNMKWNWLVVSAVVACIALSAEALWAESGPRNSVASADGIGCEADFDGDGEIGPADLAILLGSYGYCRNCAEDLDGDRRVDDADIDILIGYWGECDVASPAKIESIRQAKASVRRNEIEAEYSDDMVVEPEVSEGRRSCPADLDEDGEVGPVDLAILLGGYGYCRNCAEDLDGDRRVDDADLDVLIGDWGACPARGAVVKDSCRSDFNGDGDIGPVDLAVLLGSYGRSNSKVDLDGDDYVDDADVDILLAAWGPCGSVH